MFNYFFSPENRVVYEITSKNIVEPEGPQLTATIWSIRVACWISKATCTHAYVHAHVSGHPHARTNRHICSTYCFSTATVVSRKRFSVMLYVHCLLSIDKYMLLAIGRIHTWEVCLPSGWQNLLFSWNYIVLVGSMDLSLLSSCWGVGKVDWPIKWKKWGVVTK
jgi:hypothetical protein